jgi:hypothetical protein
MAFGLDQFELAACLFGRAAARLTSTSMLLRRDTARILATEARDVRR